MQKRQFTSTDEFFRHGRQLACAADAGLPLPALSPSDQVALLSPVSGVTPAGAPAPLQRGQVGVVIDASDLDAVRVEFADPDGVIFACATTRFTALLPLRRSIGVG